MARGGGGRVGGLEEGRAAGRGPPSAGTAGSRAEPESRMCVRGAAGGGQGWAGAAPQHGRQSWSRGFGGLRGCPRSGGGGGGRCPREAAAGGQGTFGVRCSCRLYIYSDSSHLPGVGARSGGRGAPSAWVGAAVWGCSDVVRRGVLGWAAATPGAPCPGDPRGRQGKEGGSDLRGWSRARSPLALPGSSALAGAVRGLRGLLFGSFVPVEVGERGSGVPQTPLAPRAARSVAAPGALGGFWGGQRRETRRVSGCWRV